MGRFLTTIFLLTPQVFLEISDKIQFNEDDPIHHDNHQEPQENQGFPPSMGIFLTTIFHLTPQVLYIFGILSQNPVQ